MSFSFIKKNAFFKPLGLPAKKVATEKVTNENKGDSKQHDTRSRVRRISPKAKTACSCCVSDSSGDGQKNHTCTHCNGSDDDRIDVGEESTENADLDSTLSPASKRVRIEETKLDPLITYDEIGKKKGLKCHHCPFELPWNHGVTSRMHAHEACHFRSSQYECTLCGWNGGNVLAAKKHMTIHPEAKDADLVKKWGKDFKDKNNTTKARFFPRKKNRKVVSVSHIDPWDHRGTKHFGKTLGTGFGMYTFLRFVGYGYFTIGERIFHNFHGYLLWGAIAILTSLYR